MLVLGPGITRRKGIRNLDYRESVFRNLSFGAWRRGCSGDSETLIMSWNYLQSSYPEAQHASQLAMYSYSSLETLSYSIRCRQPSLNQVSKLF